MSKINKPIYEYNTNGNMIYQKTSEGLEAWWEYDNKGNLIHFRESNGYEAWYEYDNRGNEIHYWNNNGLDYWYDSEGNPIDKPTEKKDNTTMSNTNNDQYTPSMVVNHGVRFRNSSVLDWERMEGYSSALNCFDAYSAKYGKKPHAYIEFYLYLAETGD